MSRNLIKLPQLTDDTASGIRKIIDLYKSVEEDGDDGLIRCFLNKLSVIMPAWQIKWLSKTHKGGAVMDRLIRVEFGRLFEKEELSGIGFHADDLAVVGVRSDAGKQYD